MTDRQFWLAIRQALIIALGAIEKCKLGMECSIRPKRKKKDESGTA
jgi:hypothetical protein